MQQVLKPFPVIVWRIGFAVKDKAGTFILGNVENPSWFLWDEFTDALPTPDSNAMLDTVFSRSNPASNFTPGRYSYIVTNKKVSVLDTNGVWPTMVKAGEATDGSGQNAKTLEDALFKDGLFKVVIISKDRKDNTNTINASSEKAVVIDNFRPFLRRAEIRDSGGATKYKKAPQKQGDTYTLPNPSPNNPLGAGEYSIEIEFSEPVQNPTLSIDTLGSRDLTPAPAGSQTTFTASLPVGGESTIQDGERTMTINATDLAGNSLLALTRSDTSIDPATQVTRDSSGNMQGTGGPDTQVSFHIAAPQFLVEHEKLIFSGLARKTHENWSAASFTIASG